MRLPRPDGLLLSSIVLSGLLVVFGCASSKDQLLESEQQALKLRSIQSRAFDTTDQKQTLRSVIATMQDLEFIVDRADGTLGAVSGTKLDHGVMRLTVTVHPRGSTQVLVRANAQHGQKAIEEPVPYQNFFLALEKAMFLEARQVD